MSATSLVFLLAFSAGIGLCFLRSPVWGLYTYIAVFYLHPPSRWWGAFLPDLRWSLLAAAATLTCLLFHKVEARRGTFFAHGLAWIFLIYVIWMWVQTPFVVSHAHMTGVVLFTKYFVLLYIIYQVVNTPDRVRDFLLAHVAGCFYLGWLVFTAEGGGRLEGVGGPGIDDANTMSMHLGTGVMVAATLLMTERGWRFWLPLAALPFMVNGIIQGSSRGALLGLVAGGLCLFWLKPPEYRKQFIVFGALGALVFAYLANDFFLARMSTLEAVTSENQSALDFSAASRVVIMQAEWRMFLDHPFGAGHAGTAALSPDYLGAEYLSVDLSTPDARPARSSHNTFMSVLVDQGVPGAFLLAALVVWVWRTVGFTTRRSGQDARQWGHGAAIAAALAVAVVAGQFAPYLKAEVQIWLLAVLASLRQITIEQKAAAPVREPTVAAPPDVRSGSVGAARRAARIKAGSG